MYNYQYTFDIKEWNDQAKDYLNSISLQYNLEYFIEKNLVDDKEIILNFRGQKDDLDRFEPRFIKEFLDILKVEDFVKSSTEITPKILQTNSDFDINSCNLNLHVKRKRVITLDVKEEIVKLLKSGKIGLIRNINGYYLVALATKSKSVKNIRELLNLPTKTLPLLIKNSSQARFANFSKKEEELINSNIKPFVRVKKRQLHRLEKIKNAPVGSVTFNNFYLLKLPKNSFEEYLAKTLNQPLVFYKTSSIESYIDKIDFLVNAPKSFIDYPDSYMQKVYGKDMILSVGYGLAPLYIKLPSPIKKECFSKDKSNIAIAKDDMILCSCNIKERDFFNINNFKSDFEIKADKKDYLAILHRFLSGYDNAIIFNFENDKGSVLEYKDQNLKELYLFEDSLKDLYNKTIDFKPTYHNEAQLLAESKYEICHEQSFDFKIEKNSIKIEFDKNLDQRFQGSALINTLTKIVQDIVKKYENNYIFCGEIFENKNLTENIIEFLEEENKNFFISDKVPLNSSVKPMGILLDFYLKN